MGCFAGSHIRLQGRFEAGVHATIYNSRIESACSVLAGKVAERRIGLPSVAHIRIFKHYIRTPYLLLTLLEAILLTVSIWFVVAFASTSEAVLRPPELLYRAMWSAFVLMACSLAMNVYPARLKDGFTAMFLRSLVSFFLLGSVLLYLTGLSLPQLALPRGNTSMALVLSLVVSLTLREIFFAVVDTEALRRYVLVLGAGAKARGILEDISAHAGTRAFRLMGFVPGNNEEICVDPAVIVRPTDGLLQYARENHIDEIVVALEERRRSEGGNLPLKELLDCKLNGIQILDGISFYEREVQKIELSLLNPSWIVFSDGFRYSALRDNTKRIVDLLIALLLLVVLWPVMLLTALAIWLESGLRGPVLYRQTRLGYGGRQFQLLKFRSMRTDAEKDGAVWARENDDRITRVGHLIRNTRLDELPQLYNVLRGEMSIVGPRPERPEFVCDLRQQIPYYDERHRVKPGLMGWAQLCYPYGASVEDAAQKLRYDLYYIKNHSLLLDLLIMVQTVEVILIGKGVR